MNFHFTNPNWLFALVPALAWVVWLAVKSDVQTAKWRRWTSGAIRVLGLSQRSREQDLTVLKPLLSPQV
mgnify:CR=1 FL=1